jgi:hypothetical protein
MAIAAVNNLLVHKGLLSVDDIELALHKAEASLTGDERVHEDMSPANRDAICFPVRVLRMANNAQGEAKIPPFPSLPGWSAAPRNRTTIRGKNMSDDKSKTDNRDRSQVAGDEEYEIGYVASKFGPSLDQVRELIAVHGNNRDVIEREAEKLKRG